MLAYTSPPDGTYPVVMEYCVNKNLDETYRYVSENDKETNRDAMKMVIEEFPDDLDEDEKVYISEKKQKSNTQSYY